MKFPFFLLVIAVLVVDAWTPVGAATLAFANFDDGEDGFAYCDDPFLGTNLPDFADGTRVTTEGYGGSGALLTTLGNVGTAQTVGASGGWCYTMNLAAPANNVEISLRYKLRIDTQHTYDEYSRVLVSVDGNLLGRGAKSYVDHLGGSALDAGSVPFQPDTDWQQVVIRAGNLDAGLHQWRIGVYNNKGAVAAATTRLLIDDVSITSENPLFAASGPHVLVGRLDLVRFKTDIESVASFGDRVWLSPSFLGAQAWVAGQLDGLGYEVGYHKSHYDSHPISNLYVTKVGRTRPDQMYIVSAHLDGRGGGGAADDDGSGVALLLEMARVLAATDVETDISIRLIFWDDEEWGYGGSQSYVADRGPLQGIEKPPGSGVYPEPLWLGVIQHDMLLYDHGIDPVSSSQSPFADMDVEWGRYAAKAAEGRALALAWHHWAGEYASIYPSTPYDYGFATDDVVFRDKVAAVSVRENRRLDGSEWRNPNWHAATDLYSSYSAKDFELGFNAVQATLGTVATLAGARILLGDEIFRDAFDIDGAGKNKGDGVTIRLNSARDVSSRP